MGISQLPESKYLSSNCFIVRDLGVNAPGSTEQTKIVRLDYPARVVPDTRPTSSINSLFISKLKLKAQVHVHIPIASCNQSKTMICIVRDQRVCLPLRTLVINPRVCKCNNQRCFHTPAPKNTKRPVQPGRSVPEDRGSSTIRPFQSRTCFPSRSLSIESDELTPFTQK